MATSRDLLAGAAARPMPIAGVSARPLHAEEDIRGSLAEFHRDSWGGAPRPVQWDVIRSAAGVLRGVHVHRLRYDILLVLEGRATIGLSDLRRGAESFGRGMAIEADGAAPATILVPPGVAHGIHASTPLLYLYGLTAEYDGLDQAGCRWDDPALGIPWQISDPLLLPRDAALPSRDALLAAFEAAGGVA